MSTCEADWSVVRVCVCVCVLACLMGATLYRFAVALALNADFLGFQASDVQLVTALLVAIALIAQQSGSFKTILRKGSRK